MVQNNGLISLFSGIGGFEKGFNKQGFETLLSCEIEDKAQQVMRKRFRGLQIKDDVAQLKSLPRAKVLTAGFPCQNLSLVGNNSGIEGRDTKIVHDLFRLIYKTPTLDWIVLENVPFMLWQKKGEAIEYITRKLTEFGLNWAYRVVDVRAFGLPQRRRRVIIVASKKHDPRYVLFSDHVSEPSWILDDGAVPAGFSWTEGRYGVGWAPNCVPTIRGGSRVGVPSPPAIWFRDSGLVGTPTITDAERLQGFPADWTKLSNDAAKRDSFRWKLVGNAIPVPLASWIAKRIKEPKQFDIKDIERKWQERVWPNAAYNLGDEIRRVEISEFPEEQKCNGLATFLKDPVKPLSAKATKGFLKRAREGKCKFKDGFLEALELHAEQVEQNKILPKTLDAA